MMLHDVLGVQPRPRGHSREFRERRRGRVLGMQDDRAFEALGLSHRIHDKVVTGPDDVLADGKVRSPDFSNVFAASTPLKLARRWMWLSKMATPRQTRAVS